MNVSSVFAEGGCPDVSDIPQGNLPWKWYLVEHIVGTTDTTAHCGVTVGAALPCDKMRKAHAIEQRGRTSWPW
jgi:hypothetical protein